MPRGKKRTTMSGDPAQSVSSVPGQRYGEGKESAAIQQAMPAPDLQGAIPTGAGSAAIPPNVPAPPPPQADPAMVQQFLSTHNPNMLSGTQIPDQPVTAGLSRGPGPGPMAALRTTTPMARYMQRLADDTGNEKWRRLAERAGLT